MNDFDAKAVLTLQNKLTGFYTSKASFKYSDTSDLTYTPGFKAFMEHAGSGTRWLLDLLASVPEVMQQAKTFATVTLDVWDDNSAMLRVRDRDKQTILLEIIDFTDCPPYRWVFYLEENTLMLPTERDVVESPKPVETKQSKLSALLNVFIPSH